MIRIVSAEPLSDCRLKITFNDGVSGIFPVEPGRRGGVFLKLLDAKVFNAVTINPDFGCMEWPGGIDLCPDTMHQDMTGSESEAELHSFAALREDEKSESPSSLTSRKAGRRSKPSTRRLSAEPAVRGPIYIHEET